MTASCGIIKKCGWGASNPHGPGGPPTSKAGPSTDSGTPAQVERLGPPSEHAPAKVYSSDGGLVMAPLAGRAYNTGATHPPAGRYRPSIFSSFPERLSRAISAATRAGSGTFRVLRLSRSVIWSKATSERGSSSMSTWYKIGRWEPKIEPVEVVKHTEKTVTLAKTQYWRERRADRQGLREQYYPTWQEAHTALMRRAVGELDSARRGLQQAEGFYGNVKGMKQPESENDGQS